MNLGYLWVVAVALLLGACSSGDDGSPGSAPEASTSPPSSSEPSACPEVRAGIAAFNANDFERTVDRFETALPLAREQDDEEDTAATADLLEAVEYYVDLAPDDYPEAAATSRDFAKYKQITLGQCLASDEQQASPSDEPVPA